MSRGRRITELVEGVKALRRAAGLTHAFGILDVPEQNPNHILVVPGNGFDPRRRDSFKIENVDGFTAATLYAYILLRL